MRDERHLSFLFETLEADWQYSLLHAPVDVSAIFYGGITSLREGNEISCVLVELDEDSKIKQYQIKTGSTADALQMRYFWSRRYDCLYLFKIGQDNLVRGQTYSSLNGNLEALDHYREYSACTPGDAACLPYLCSAADQGHPDAQIEVGRHFAQGNYGIQKEHRSAYCYSAARVLQNSRILLRWAWWTSGSINHRKIR